MKSGNFVSEIAPGKRMKKSGSVQSKKMGVQSKNMGVQSKKMGGKGRILAALLLSLSMLSIYGISGLHGAETVSVNKEFNKREIKVRVGGMVRVSLEQLGAAGYVWKVQNLNGEYFEIVNEQTKDAPEPSEITGAPVMKTWLIRTKKAGRSELKLIYYRPWEDEKSPSDTFVLRVRIIP
jgi:predicted secreted protein